MKTLLFTEFRKNASNFISQVEHGETLVLLRRGRPVAEVIPFSEDIYKIPSWKKHGIRLQIDGKDLSSAILEERNEDNEGSS